MNSLPQTNNTLLVRTDFSDQAAWEALHSAITTPNEDGFLANLHIVNDPQYRDVTTEQIVALVPARGFLVIIADKTALTAPGMPLLSVMPYEEDDDEYDQDHGELRVIAEQLWAIENNLSVGNMDWEEFTDAADDEDVFRGF